MPADISPKKVQDSVHRGFDRFQNFRNARLMFLRNYVGQYYDRDQGEVGTEALNLIFNAIRILVPNMVMNFPQHKVTSDYLVSREYGELLGMALSWHDKRNRIRDVYRRVIVDAIFTLGVLKTGLAESSSVYAFDEYDQVDAGEVYTEAVDFDNFVVDPASRDHLFRDAAWLGDRICVPRDQLLESGLYNNDLIERLPTAGQQPNKDDYASKLSMKNINSSDDYELQDEVEIVELWVPSANALVTVPGSKHVSFDDYLRVDEYYGPDDGPYTMLALTPPVPGNPLPVPTVGVWNDLHTLGNRMAKKIIDQAERQKDIVTYRRASADDAQEMLDAGDGEAVASDDPDGVRVLSFGGQQQSNEIHLAQLQNWFNMLAANPQQIGGERFDADSATEAKLLARNASIGIEDMKDLVYQMAADEARKRAWYFHTDPLIQVPLIRRVNLPADFRMGPGGQPQMTAPAMTKEVQVYLTPEARRGDFLDFTFNVEPESMGRKDSNTRFQESMDFAVKIMPAAMQAAQTAALLGIPFSAQKFITRMAKDRGIDWMDEVFYDPEFQQTMMMRMMAGPDPAQSQGQVQQPNAGAGGGPQANPLAALLQNGQPGQVGKTVSPETRDRQESQGGATAQAQSDLKRGMY